MEFDLVLRVQSSNAEKQDINQKAALEFDLVLYATYKNNGAA